MRTVALPIGMDWNKKLAFYLHHLLTSIINIACSPTVIRTLDDRISGPDALDHIPVLVVACATKVNLIVLSTIRFCRCWFPGASPCIIPCN